MKITFKKLLIPVIALLFMLCIIIPIRADNIASGECGTNLEWVLTDENVLIISGTGNMKNFDSLFDTPWNNYRNQVKSIVVEEGVTGIGEHAFMSLHKLTSVSLPYGLKTIGNSAFYADSALESISIPNSVIKLGANSFNDCTNLISVTLSEGLIEIEGGTFEKCSALESIIIPEKVSELGFNAFQNCGSLHTVYLPSTLKTINYFCFSKCYSLTDIFYDGCEHQWNKVEINLIDEELDSVQIHKAEFKEQTISGDAATCTKAGLTEGAKCSVCGEIIKQQQTIPALGHKKGATVTENVVKATCEKAGSHDEVVYCNVCNKELSRKTVTDPVLGHSWGEWIVTKAATATEDGEETRICKNDPSHKEARKIPATGEPETPAEPEEPATEAPEEPTPSTPAAPTGDGFPDVTHATVNNTSYNAIYWAVDNGIVKGYADGNFQPETVCTREQFSIMLWRFAGEPSANSGSVNKFTDAGDFSSGAKKAVAWAVEQGIVAGFSDGSFRPKDYITRAQVAVMLWRYAGKPGVSGGSKFSDIGSFSANVQNAIIWLQDRKIASGYSDGTFKPNDGCQRQHMAIFLYRYSNNIR